MSRALVPAMIRLCESCATDEPSAPSRVSPNPLTSPRPIRPEARCRSMLAIKRTSRSGSNAQWPLKPADARARTRRVTIWSGTISMTGQVFAREGQAEASARPERGRWIVFSCASRGSVPVLQALAIARRDPAVLDHGVRTRNSRDPRPGPDRRDIPAQSRRDRRGRNAGRVQTTHAGPRRPAARRRRPRA